MSSSDTRITLFGFRGAVSNFLATLISRVLQSIDFAQHFSIQSTISLEGHEVSHCELYIYGYGYLPSFSASNMIKLTGCIRCVAVDESLDGKTLLTQSEKSIDLHP